MPLQLVYLTIEKHIHISRNSTDDREILTRSNHDYAKNEEKEADTNVNFPKFNETHTPCVSSNFLVLYISGNHLSISLPNKQYSKSLDIQ